MPKFNEELPGGLRVNAFVKSNPQVEDPPGSHLLKSPPVKSIFSPEKKPK
jgi:hypothetical protein